MYSDRSGWLWRLSPRCSVMVSNLLAISFKRTLEREDEAPQACVSILHPLCICMVLNNFSWAELPRSGERGLHGVLEFFGRSCMSIHKCGEWSPLQERYTSCSFQRPGEGIDSCWRTWISVEISGTIQSCNTVVRPRCPESCLR